MEYTPPPDIPQAVINLVDTNYRNSSDDIVGRWFKYLTIWKGNLEVYITGFRYKPLPPDPKTGEPVFRITGLPQIIIYDCHEARRASLEEVWDIHSFMNKYYIKNLQSEHLCHKDIEAFKAYKTPNPYKQHKPQYVTPKYIPKSVVKYINKQFPISWYPNTYIRYTKYLTTYKNEYEVYFVYWLNPITNEKSNGKYVLYDCENSRSFKNNHERIDLIFLHTNPYNSDAQPTLCKNKKLN